MYHSAGGLEMEIAIDQDDEGGLPYTTWEILRCVQKVQQFAPEPQATETEHVDAHVKAWQRLIHTGIVWHLDGWFKHCALLMLENGLCTLPGKEQEI
jgi:hypothetical protein